MHIQSAHSQIKKRTIISEWEEENTGHHYIQGIGKKRSYAFFVPGLRNQNHHGIDKTK